MSGPIQDFGHGSSQYERPTMKWVCGWQAQGQPCHVGPNSRGQCEVHRECVPHQDGEEFVCARPPVWGGKCKDGPLLDGSCCETRVRCQPRRNLFARRRMAVVLASSLAFGFLLIMFGGSNAEQFISPGDLSAPHFIAANDCKKCHAAAGNDLKTWASWARRPSEVVSRESDACRECHKFGNHALDPHNLDPRLLDDARNRLAAAPNSRSRSWIVALAEIGPGIASTAAKEELACSTCHHEHRGKSFNLKQMSDQQCQTCHVNKFHGFDRGHPSFTDFPYERRVRIHFDHSTHFGTHFANFERIMPHGKAPQGYTAAGLEKEEAHDKLISCYACHKPDHTGENMLVKSFNVMCGKCHGPQIQDTMMPGIPFLALPDIVDQMKVLKISIGEWPKPETPSGVGLEDLPPFMQLLLAGDDEFLNARKVLSGVRLAELAEPNDEQREAIQTTVWSIKRLIHDLVADYDGRVQAALNGISDSTERTEQRAILSGYLPSGMSLKEVVGKAQKMWFPNLSAEIAALESGQELESTIIDIDLQSIGNQIEEKEQQLKTKELADDTLIDKLKQLQMLEMELKSAIRQAADRGWYRDDEDTSIRYHSSGHADPFLKEWIDITGRLPIVEKSFHAHDANSREPDIDFRSASAVRLFTMVADPKAPFRCTACHTVDRRSDIGALVTNWNSLKAFLGEHKFTRFSHAPHVILLHSSQDSILKKKQCNHCHVHDKGPYSFARTEFVVPDFDWHVNTNSNQVDTSGFAAMIKKTCEACHNSRQLSGSCLECHNYHVGTFNLGH